MQNKYIDSICNAYIIVKHYRIQIVGFKIYLCAIYGCLQFYTRWVDCIIHFYTTTSKLSNELWIYYTTKSKYP